MPRAIWKGAISFGLVHVPVGLYPASQDVGIDFDWLDKRSMDPVGYQRINKRTGKTIEGDDIVKGIKQEGGEYVVLSEDEIKAAYPKTTQTIELESFVKRDEISFLLLETPYYLEPSGRGADKVYALLREAMNRAGVIGIGRVVIHTKEHLAALIPNDSALVLNTIRWASEIRPIDELKLPDAGKASAPKPAELAMAVQLIADMTAPWKADASEDIFTAAVHKLVARKVAAGQTETVEPLEEAPSEGTASNVVDLTELLKRSLGQRAPAAKPAAKAAKAKPKPAAKRARG
ncbi:MAG: Ku protein [Burkholderiaceae bacterium]